MASVGNVTAKATEAMSLLSSALPGSNAKGVGFDQVMQSSFADRSQEMTTKIPSLEGTKNASPTKQSPETVDSSVNQKAFAKNSSDTTDISPEQAQQAAETVETAVKDAVKEVLDIDEETLEKVMAELGIVPIDLLQLEKLQQLVLLVEGGKEPTDLLLDEDMMADLQALSTILQGMDLEQMTGMPKEDLAALMQNPLLEEAAEIIPEASAMVEETVEPESMQAEGTVESTVKVVVTDQREQPKTAVLSEASAENGATETEDISVADTAKSFSEGSEENLSQDSQEMPERSTASEVHSTVVETPVAANPFQPFAVQAVEEAMPTQPLQQMTEIVEQIVEQIRVNLQPDTTTMEMHLNPESLGKVLLTVSTKAGVMTANFTVQTEEARLALESQMYTLRETLEQKELKVEAVEVTVSEFEFTQEGNSGDDQKNLEQGDGRSRHFRVEGEEESDDSTDSPEAEAERVRRSVMRDNGSSIDFTA